MNRSTRNILIGLALGIATVLFLGELAWVFKFVADAYVRLLQMTVLPYLIVSLIGGVGSLDASKARQLFLRVGLLTIVLWGLALGLVFLLPLAFPTVQTASFFSTSLVEETPPLDFISLYIPTNAFQSLANNVVPAVVLFSGFVGVALIGIEQKEPLLSLLSVVEKVLGRANKFAVRLTPIGLFAIAANTVGTMDTEQVSRLRVFLIGYGAMSLLLTLWILPGLVSCLTGIPARRVLQATRDALITAFIEAKGTTALVKRQGGFQFMFFLNSRRRGYLSSARVNSVSALLIAAALLLGPITQLCPISRAETKRPSQETRKQISLPTPRSHYDTFKRGTSGLPLLMDLMKEFEPQAQKVLLRFAFAAGLQNTNVNSEEALADLKKLQSMAEAAGIPSQPPLVRETAVALLKKTDWAAHRPIIIEFLVHQTLQEIKGNDAGDNEDCFAVKAEI